MEIPKLYEVGDEDEAYASLVPERNLYLAVFITAVSDVVAGEGSQRQLAVDWFKGAPGHITFAQVLSLFKFSASRLRKLDEMIGGGLIPKKAIVRRRYNLTIY